MKCKFFGPIPSQTLLNVTSCAGFLIFAGTLLGQTNQPRSFLPFLDKESQSNVVVMVSYSGGAESCPPEYTNVLSNTILFTPEEQKAIKEVFVKYQNVTTNSGPIGTVFSDLYKTNFMVKSIDGPVKVEQWVARFEYTNFEAHEMIYFGAGIGPQFRTKAGDGYDAALTQVGGGSLLHFKEIKQNSPNGIYAIFHDNHDQGVDWNYERTDFRDAHLEQYLQYTNGLVIGKYLMWNPEKGTLLYGANFNEPYDFEKHRTDRF